MSALAVLAAAAPAAAGAVEASPPPPGRGYELVSPADTSDAPLTGGVLAAPTLAMFPDGRIVFGSDALTPTSPDQDGGFGSQYVGTRTATGWRSSLILPPDPTHATIYTPVDATQDLETVVFAGTPGTGATDVPPSGVPAFRRSYDLLRRRADGTVAPIYAVSRPEAFQSVGFVGMARDGGDVYFATDDPPPGTDGPAGVSQVYRRTADGRIASVGVDADGRPLSACGVSASGFGYNIPGFATSPSGPNGVSVDGSVAYLGTGSFGADGECADGLFAATPHGVVSITAPVDGAPASSQSAAPVFVGASPDGRTAYFMTSDGLTADDGNGVNDIYRASIDPDTGRRAALACLTCGIDPDDVVSAPGATMSADGTHVYFITTRGGGGYGAHLYVAHGGRIDRVSAAADLRSNGGGADPSRVRTTPDGQHVLYVTQDPSATGSGGQTQLAWAASVGPDGATPSVCVSCDLGPEESSLDVVGLDGVSTGNGGFGQTLPGTQVYGRGLPISDDGTVVAFSAESSETDKTDVYVREGGRLSRVNPGTETSDANFMSLSPDGRDLFFLDSQPLTFEATQSSSMLYDARIGGGFAPPADRAPCAADDCQGPRPSPPAAPAAVTGAAVPESRGSQDPPPARRATLRVSRGPRTERRLELRVRPSAAGKLRVSGPDVRTASRTIARAGSYMVFATLSRRAQRTLKRRRTLTTVVRVRFVPRGGKAVSTVLRVTFARGPRSSRKAR